MRIGLMSVAHGHAGSYVTHLKSQPQVEIIGISDHDVARGQQFSTQHDLQWFDTYELLLSEELDGVIICSENSRHHDLTLMAADAKTHVLCEKPLATTVADSIAMVKACEVAGV